MELTHLVALAPIGLYSCLKTHGPCWPLLAPAGPCWPLLAPAGPCWPLLALAIHNAHDCRSWRAWLRMCRTGTYMPSRQNWASCGFVGRIGRIVGGCRRISLYISVSQMMHGFVICRVKYPDLANKSLIAFLSPAWCRYKVSGLMQKNTETQLYNVIRQ